MSSALAAHSAPIRYGLSALGCIDQPDPSQCRAWEGAGAVTAHTSCASIPQSPGNESLTGDGMNADQIWPLNRNRLPASPTIQASLLAPPQTRSNVFAGIAGPRSDQAAPL